MSDSQTHEDVTVGSDGVTVTKRFEEDEFPVPAIAFEFESSRDEPVRIRLSDGVPDGVAVEDLGFHPEYGSEYWTVDEDIIVFERELEPGAAYTTVYGVRATGADSVEQFLTEPTIEEVDPPLPGDGPEPAITDAGDADDVVIPEEDDIVADTTAGEGEASGLEDEDEAPQLDLSDPSAPGESADAGVEGSGSVVAAMANEIRTDDVTAENLEIVQRAFAELADATPDGSTEARLEKLQSDVADLRAYMDALEEFLDEEGTGQQLIDEFQGELDAFGERLGRIESDLESNNASVTDMEAAVDDLQGEMDEMTEDIEEVTESVDDLQGEMDEMTEDIEEVAESVDDLRSTVEDVEESVDEDVIDRVEDLENDLQDLLDWQEQIKKTFGGGG